MEWPEIVAGVGLSAALLALAAIDARTLRLPNAITYPLVAAGIAWNGWWTGAWMPWVVGAALGYGVFVAVELLYARLRGRAGLGRGDAKLLAAGGAWCGWEGLPFIVLVGSASAIAMLLVFRERLEGEGGRVAFGPFLALGIGAVWWAGLLAG